MFSIGDIVVFKAEQDHKYKVVSTDPFSVLYAEEYLDVEFTDEQRDVLKYFYKSNFISENTYLDSVLNGRLRQAQAEDLMAVCVVAKSMTFQQNIIGLIDKIRNVIDTFTKPCSFDRPNDQNLFELVRPSPSSWRNNKEFLTWLGMVLQSHNHSLNEYIIALREGKDEDWICTKFKHWESYQQMIRDSESSAMEDLLQQQQSNLCSVQNKNEQPCSECKGSGFYQGLEVREPCRKCKNEK